MPELVAILHTVNKSPLAHATLASCLRLARPGASVLLIEDGVYAALAGTAAADALSKAKSHLTFYVLGPDLQARGLSESEIIDGVEMVDYCGFVDLVVAHETSQAWL